MTIATIKMQKRATKKVALFYYGIRSATAIVHKKNCKEKKNNLKNKLLFHKDGQATQIKRWIDRLLVSD